MGDNMVKKLLGRVRPKVLGGRGISRQEASAITVRVIRDFSKFKDVLELTNETRRKFFDGEIRKCSDGFTSNKCSNTCNFCPLSRVNHEYSKEKGILPRALHSVKEFVEDAKEKERTGATQYKIVGCERKLAENEFRLAVEAFKAIEQETNMGLCASMGVLDAKHLEMLKEAGVMYFNHNLERRDYSSLTSCFTFDKKVKTNKLAAEVGLKRCSGIIVGLGEDLKERIDVGFVLQKLGIESAPINVFVHVRPEQDGIPRPSKEELLLTIALYRLMLPKSHLILNNGSTYFKDFLDIAIMAGASGYGMKGPEDRKCYLPNGKVDDRQALKAIMELGLK